MNKNTNPACNKINLIMLPAKCWPFCLCFNFFQMQHFYPSYMFMKFHFSQTTLKLPVSISMIFSLWNAKSDVWYLYSITLQWCHNGHGGVSNHQPHHCLFNHLLRHRSKNKSKLRVTGLCAGNSPVTGEFPAQMASKAENVSIWWRHHDK